MQMFDNDLCVRQLRYSGMMETARIRRAGYPIRHSYREFVERYKYLMAGIGPINQIDHRVVSKKICKSIFHNVSDDYQFGDTKIFLKDFHDILLEEERSRIFLKHILVLQRGFRRIIFRRWIHKIRNAAVTIQKHWRSRGYRTNYLTMRIGFYRLQACIQSRQLVHKFGVLKKNVIGIQARCRGYLTRKHIHTRITEKAKCLQEIIAQRQRDEQEFKRAGNPNWEEDAKVNFMARFAELSRRFDIVDDRRISGDNNDRKMDVAQTVHRLNAEEDNRVVDDVFGFLRQTSDGSGGGSVGGGVNGVSEKIVLFEAESKIKKIIPRKLLSRPVQFYSYTSSRL